MQNRTMTEGIVLGMVLDYVARRCNNSITKTFCEQYFDQYLSLETIFNYHQVTKQFESCNENRNEIETATFETNAKKESPTKNEILNDNLTGSKSREFEASCCVITCEEALLNKNNIAATCLGTLKISHTNKSNSNRHTPNLLANDEHILESKSYNLQTESTISGDFNKLLSYATTFPKRLHRNKSMYNPVLDINDAYYNKSILFQRRDEATHFLESRPISNEKTMNDIHGMPSKGDIIAFKLLEMSANYTPVVSDYKTGEVIETFTNNDSLKIKMHSPLSKINNTEMGKFDLPDFTYETDTESEYIMTFQLMELYNLKSVL